MAIERKRLGVIAIAGALALAGCATADLRPGIVRHETPKQIRSKFHGPDVMIRANVLATSNSRSIEPVVSLGDSAYIVVGDIGDDGTLRIVYPARPGDPHLAQTRGRFQAPRFSPRIILPFAETAYMRARMMTRTAPGITFVIASSLPLNLEKLAEGDRWSIFDVYYDNHDLDPRPAITDLAAAISTDVGQISIAYAPYAWGFVGPRAGAAQRSTTYGDERRRLPRPPG
jgi:hypothetical protein